MVLNPLRLDPTRTISLRRSFNQSLSTLFNQLMREIRQLIVDEDAFGLKRELTLSLNRDYASTQMNVEDTDVISEVKRIQKSLQESDVVELDKQPHITVRYGLLDQPRMDEGVKTLLKDFGPIQVTIGELSIFETEDADVLKFDIESGKLRELNARLKLLPNYEKYQYHPHLTVAYLKKGAGQDYIQKSSITGKKITFDTLTYSDSDRKQIDLILVNKRWKYQTQSQAVDQFDKWIEGKIDSLVLSAQEVAKWKKYIEKGFQKGANRAFDDTKKGKADFQAILRASGFVEDRREQFVRQSLSRATAAEKLKLLDERALAEVVGMTRDLKSKARRVLTDGLVKGQSPTQIAKALSTLLNISKGRAQTIANTELVRAHAEGQLEAMEQLGVASVGIAVEWSTAFNPCKVCQPLKGIVLSLPEARGLLPRHPNCRCAWLPAGIGEDKTIQKRGKYKIDKAIAQSQKRASDSDEWGPSKEVSRKRPIVNMSCTCSDGLAIFAKLLEQVEVNK